MENKVTVRAGIGFPGLLTLLLIALKLTGYIAWSWWLVLFFVWFPVALVLLAALAILILVVIELAVGKWQRWRDKKRMAKIRAVRAKQLLEMAARTVPLGD